MSEMQFPHCDPRILHAPYACEHCDRHPDWQELRWRWGIAFTGQRPKDGELPCPADAAKPPGSPSGHWQGAGNQPSMLTGPRGVPYSKADEDAIKAEITEGRGEPAERMAEWAKHDRYLDGTGQVELCPQCGVTKLTGPPCPGCHPERRLPRIIPLEPGIRPAGTFGMHDGPWGWLMSRIERVRKYLRRQGLLPPDG